jgi:CDP-diglyceride synthetase
MYKKKFTIQISSDIKVDEITCNKLRYKTIRHMSCESSYSIIYYNILPTPFNDELVQHRLFSQFVSYLYYSVFFCGYLLFQTLVSDVVILSSVLSIILAVTELVTLWTSHSVSLLAGQLEADGRYWTNAAIMCLWLQSSAGQVCGRRVGTAGGGCWGCWTGRRRL